MRFIKIIKACGTAGGSWAVDQIVGSDEMAGGIMDILIKLGKAVDHKVVDPEPVMAETPEPKRKTTKKRGKK